MGRRSGEWSADVTLEMVNPMAKFSAGKRFYQPIGTRERYSAELRLIESLRAFPSSQCRTCGKEIRYFHSALLRFKKALLIFRRAFGRYLSKWKEDTERCVLYPPFARVRGKRKTRVSNQLQRRTRCVRTGVVIGCQFMPAMSGGLGPPR